MNKEVRDDSFEQPAVRPDMLPPETRFKIAETGNMSNEWLTKLRGDNVRIGEITGGNLVRREQTARINPNSVVTDAMLPSIEEVSERHRNERTVNDKSDYYAQIPSWSLRLRQAQERHQSKRALTGLPVYGPDKNPLDNEHVQSTLDKVPFDAFFALSDQNPNAPVYVKISDGYCQKVCTLGEWTSGNIPFTFRSGAEKNMNEFGIKTDARVIVLNAPSAAEEQELIAAAEASRVKKGLSIDENQRQYWAKIMALAENFGNAA